MKRRALFLLIAAGGVAAVQACANDDSTPPVTETPDAHDIVIPVDASEAGADAPVDAAPFDCKSADFCAVAAPITPLVSLNAIWGSSATDVWIVGSSGTILHGDGTTFTSITNADAGADTSFFSLWGAAKDDVWVGPARAPLHYAATTDGGTPIWQVAQGTSWSKESTDQGRVSAIWGSSSSNVWIAGPQSARFGGYGSFWSSGAIRGALVWNEVDAYQGTDVTGPSIRALWGAGPSDIFAVGDMGKAFRFVPAAGKVAARWNAIDTFTTAPLDAVWGASATDVWAVGAEGTLRHFTGDGFAAVTAPTTQSLHGVWGTDASDVWAVGEQGTIVHYDGKTWTVEPSGSSVALFAIWGTSSDDLWIGGAGVLLHRTATNRRLP